MTTDPHLASAMAPRSILILKVDTLGDLVLIAPALAALRARWPDTRITVLIRQGYAELGPLLVGGVEWLTTTIDPFVEGPNQRADELRRLSDTLGRLQPDLIAAATSRRNWLEIALAALSHAHRRVALGATTEDEFFATQLRVSLGVDAEKAFTEHVSPPDDEPDWRRNFRLVDTMVGSATPRQQPAIGLAESIRDRADEFLRQHDLRRGAYAVLAPAGFANVTLKTWPADRFAAVARHVRERHGLAVVLVGSESEKAHLEHVQSGAGGMAKLWIGRDGSLPDLVSLLAGAAIFVGNDTGAMHLAAALDVPTVGVFGGGTWPRFAPAGRRTVAVVQPLPCFGCGWDCAFGDAPCVRAITVEDVNATVDAVRQHAGSDFSEIRKVERFPETVRAIMGQAAARYRAARDEHLKRQHKLEELTALDREKDREISSLKSTCDERERTLIRVDGDLRRVLAHVATIEASKATLEADKATLEKTLRELPPDSAHAARAIADQAVHIRNIESLLWMREQELAELRATASNRAAGLHDLEQAKHYGRLLAEKENVIRTLRRSCDEREAVIRELSANATTASAKARKAWRAARAFAREKLSRPIASWIYRITVDEYWMQIGVLQHYRPRNLRWDDRLPVHQRPAASLPRIGIVTPSYRQERFLERTLASVLNQQYPKLEYVVQDGASPDRSPEIIARHASRLRHWESAKDNGQADAISRGFRHIDGVLGPEDVMAWLNSDDLLGPGVLRFVGEYFSTHRHVDVVYGHRIIIDDDNRDVGRWIMPRHHARTLEWIDYIPQETLFWRKRAWDLVGGIDPSYQFALDWDLLARFQQAGCRIVRVPYFLGAFRVHQQQKTSQAIHTTGADEMRRIRTRFHGEKQDDPQMIERYARHTRFWGAITARLQEIGIRW